MKRIWILLVLLFSMFLVTACGEPSVTPTEDHSHKYVSVDEVSATCLQPGVKAHYVCSECLKVFVIENNEFKEVGVDDLKINQLAHNLVKVEAKAATETENGNIEYYQCRLCNKYFADGEAKNEITLESTIINALGHTHSYTLVELVPATCKEDGMKEHYVCGCGKLFSLVDGNYVEVNGVDLKLDKLSHNYQLTFTWNADLTAATAKVYCQNCNEVFITANAEIVSSDIESGVKTVKVSYTYLGQTYEETRTLLIEVDSELGISVSSNAGLPEGITLNASLVEKEDVKFVSDGINNAVVAAFEINLSQDGVSIQPSGKIQIAIPYNELFGTNFKLYHIHQEGNDVTTKEVVYQIKDGKIVFEVENLSQFVLVEEYSFEKVAGIPATCTSEGRLEHFVRNDGKLFVMESGEYREVDSSELVIAHLEHIVGDPIRENEVPATCSSAGSYDEVVKCTLCGVELTRQTKEIEKLNHKPISIPAVEPTCTKTGLSEGSKCELCGEILEAQTELPALGHEALEPQKENEVAATCTTFGSYDLVTRCSRCGEILASESFETPKLEHQPGEAVRENEVPATCSSAGSYEEVRYCSLCGAEISRQARDIEQLNHKPVSIPAVEPTCTKTGLSEGSKCELCDEILEAQTELPALGHEALEPVRENEVAPTCTSEGSYDLVTRCSRCGEIIEQKTIKLAKLAHTPGEAVEENLVAATCLAAGSYEEVRYCSVCGAEVSRQARDIEKLAHDIALHDAKEPTETEEGNIEYYECLLCHHLFLDPFGEEETSLEFVKLAPVGHTHDYALVDRVEPTCTDEGRLEHYICLGCQKLFIRSNNEFVEVSATDLVIEKEPHIIEVQKNNYILPTCTEVGTYDMVTICRVCQTVLEVEHCTEPALGHLASDPVQENIVEATCVEAGSYELVVYCSRCEIEIERRVITVPATGNHQFEDGVCTVCGLEQDVTCDHQELHQVVIDLAELGFCGGKISYFTCECGEVKQLDQNCAYVFCLNNVENSYSNTEMYTKCNDCGFTLLGIRELIPVDDDNDCHFIQRVTYSFYDAFETLFLETVNDIDYYDHKGIGQKVAYEADCPDCRAQLVYQGCGRCDQIINGFSFNGSFIMEGENGNYSYTCPTCGNLYILATTSEKEEDFCVVNHKQEAFVYSSEGELLYSNAYEFQSDVHVMNEEYTLIGEDCMDGILVRRYCENCDYGMYYVTKDHRFSNSSRLNLAEYGVCTGSYIQYLECAICGQKQYQDSHIVCDFVETNRTEVVDGVTYNIQQLVCSECGFEEIITMHQEATSCVTKYLVSMQAIANGEIIFEVIDQVFNEQINHRYEETYELEGEDCEKDGIRIIRVCSVCGHKEEVFTYSHQYKEVTVDLSEYGACGGELVYSVCQACGKIDNFNPGINCRLNLVPVVEELEDGVRNTYHAECSECGLVMEGYEERHELGDCTSRIIVYVSIKIGEFEFAYTDERKVEEHKFEEVYQLLGDTCEDGYLVLRRCSICGQIEDKYQSSGHRMDKFETIIGEEYEICPMYEYNLMCSVCGKVLETRLDDGRHQFGEADIQTETGENSYTEIRTYVCESCGVTKVETQRYYQEECTAYNVFKVEYYVGETLIYEDEQVETNLHHNFDEEVQFEDELLGCEYGYTIYRYCSVCGFDEVVEGHEHQREYFEEEFGEENNSIYISGYCCPICNQILEDDLYIDLSFAFQKEEKDEEIDGQEYHVIRYFNEELGSSYTYMYYSVEINPCLSFDINYIILELDEFEVDVTYTLVQRMDKHQYEITDLEWFNEENNCNGGVSYRLVCSACGEEQFIKTWEHNIVRSIEAFGQTICGQQLYILNSCSVCGYIETQYFATYSNEGHQFSEEEETFVNDEGLRVTRLTKTCAKCGIVMVTEKTFELINEEDCYSHVDYLYKAYINGELVKQFGYESYEYAHNFQYYIEWLNGVEDCVFGVHVKRYCTQCGYIDYEDQTYEHNVTNNYGNYDLSDLDGCCGGQIYYEMCDICGKCVGFNMMDLESIHDFRVEEEITEESSYYREVRCADCGLTYIRREYIEHDGCDVYQYYIEKLIYNDEVLFESNKGNHYSEHDYELTDSYEDDEYKYYIYVCQNCNHNYVERIPRIKSSFFLAYQGSSWQADDDFELRDLSYDGLVAYLGEQAAPFKSGYNIYALIAPFGLESGGWRTLAMMEDGVYSIDGIFAFKVISYDREEEYIEGWYPDVNMGNKVINLTPETLFMPPFTYEQDEYGISGDNNPALILGPANYVIIFITNGRDNYMGAFLHSELEEVSEDLLEPELISSFGQQFEYVSIIGSMSNWEEDIDMNKISNNLWKIRYTFAANSEFKVRTNHGDKDCLWFGNDDGNNISIDAGTYDIYFRYENGYGSVWYEEIGGEPVPDGALINRYQLFDLQLDINAPEDISADDLALIEREIRNAGYDLYIELYDNGRIYFYDEGISFEGSYKELDGDYQVIFDTVNGNELKDAPAMMMRLQNARLTLYVETPIEGYENITVNEQMVFLAFDEIYYNDHRNVKFEMLNSDAESYYTEEMQEEILNAYIQYEWIIFNTDYKMFILRLENGTLTYGRYREQDSIRTNDTEIMLTSGARYDNISNMYQDVYVYGPVVAIKDVVELEMGANLHLSTYFNSENYEDMRIEQWNFNEAWAETQLGDENLENQLVASFEGSTIHRQVLMLAAGQTYNGNLLFVIEFGYGSVLNGYYDRNGNVYFYEVYMNGEYSDYSLDEFRMVYLEEINDKLYYYDTCDDFQLTAEFIPYKEISDDLEVTVTFTNTDETFYFDTENFQFSVELEGNTTYEIVVSSNFYGTNSLEFRSEEAGTYVFHFTNLVISNTEYIKQAPAWDYELLGEYPYTGSAAYFDEDVELDEETRDQYELDIIGSDNAQYMHFALYSENHITLISTDGWVEYGEYTLDENNIMHVTYLYYILADGEIQEDYLGTDELELGDGYLILHREDSYYDGYHYVLYAFYEYDDGTPFSETLTCGKLPDFEYISEDKQFTVELHLDAGEYYFTAVDNKGRSGAFLVEAEVNGTYVIEVNYLSLGVVTCIPDENADDPQITQSYALHRENFYAVTGIWLPDYCNLEVADYPYLEGDTDYSFYITGGSYLDYDAFEYFVQFFESEVINWDEEGPLEEGEYITYNFSFYDVRWISIAWDTETAAIYINASFPVEEMIRYEVLLQDDWALNDDAIICFWTWGEGIESELYLLSEEDGSYYVEFRPEVTDFKVLRVNPNSQLLPDTYPDDEVIWNYTLDMYLSEDYRLIYVSF